VADFTFPLYVFIVKKSIAVALLAFAQGALAADAGEFSLGVGFNYSRGDYGTTTTTEIVSIPIVARYDRGPWVFKLTVPYLRVSGGTSVVPGIGRVTSTNPRRRGGGAGEATADGLGDIVASATYNSFYNSATTFGVDVTGRVKVGTADRDQGLGTGENDYSVQVDAYKTYARVTYFGGIGYTELGSSPYIQLNSVLNATAGASYKLDEHNSAGLSVDTRERASPSGSPQRELTAFWIQKIDRTWKAQAYVLKGFADGSPDWGVGASVARSF
jgi:hypothetical protein